MRMIRLRGTPLRVPEIRRLPIDRIFRRTVFLLTFLAIHVSNRPTIVTQRVARSIKHVEFADGGVWFSVLRIKRFNAEVTAFDRRIEMHFLQRGSRREAG